MSYKTISPKAEYSIKFDALNGGLNLSVPDYMLSSNESPEMENLKWLDGTLSSREGQVYASSAQLGTAFTAYSRFWHGAIVAHIGAGIYVFRPSDSGFSYTQIYAGVPQVRGSFFPYNGTLFYKTKGAYIRITATETTAGYSFSASAVVGYIPVVIINAAPSTGGGDLYQSVNRYSSYRTIWYNASAGVHDYHLPFKASSIKEITVDGTVTTAYTFNALTSVVSFYTAPPVTDPATNNSVHICCCVEDADAYKSINDCRYAEVYGGTGALCIVMAGATAQPNAFFWNGQSDIAMEPGYFPAEQYQLAGDEHDAVTGFGRQQDYLVIFKQSSVGRSSLTTETINDKNTISLTFTAISASVGCDLPWSIQLVNSRLTWASTATGVHVLSDLSAALENSISRISEKVNGSALKAGLLEDLKKAGPDGVCSIDDGENYWLCANGHCWLWNYSISTASDPSWFYYTEINAKAFIFEAPDLYHLDTSGRLIHFERCFSDFGEAIGKVYRFAASKLGSYDYRKNIDSVIIAMRNDADNYAVLSYAAESDLRQDLTPLDGSKFAEPNDFALVFRRRPGIKRAKHFSFKLENSLAGKDLSIISAEIFFRYGGKLR